MINEYIALCVLLLGISVSALCAGPLPAAEDLGTIFVTDTRLESRTLRRAVTILGVNGADRPPLSSPQELLKRATGVDVQSRGPYGVQSDISIRGATFQQSLILIDGSRMNDPQSAHHNFNLPVAAEDIQRIEVLHGHGSSLYGPDAFGGVVNIITRRPGNNRLCMDFSYGDFHSHGESVSLERKGDNLSHRISLERRESDGWRYDTDFEVLNLSVKSLAETPFADFELYIGLNDKSFGAFDFYTPGEDMPSREWIETKLFRLAARRESASSALFYRLQDDEFMLDRTRPDYFDNRTKTEGMGWEFYVNANDLVLGGDVGMDSIENESTGNHQRHREGVFTEKEFCVVKNLSAHAGLRLDYYSLWDWYVSPGLTVEKKLFPSAGIFASYGRVHRIPDYTELYYKSPYNEGNPDLKPEKGDSYELGARIQMESLDYRITFYLRDERDLIDWIKEEEGQKQWKADNVSSALVRGFEGDFRLAVDSVTLSLNHSVLKISSEQTHVSKYLFRYPEYQCSLGLSFPVLGMFQQVEGIFKDRYKEDGYFVVDWSAEKRFGSLKYYVQLGNVFDTSYEEVNGVPQPGRWVWTGIKIEL